MDFNVRGRLRDYFIAHKSSILHVMNKDVWETLDAAQFTSMLLQSMPYQPTVWSWFHITVERRKCRHALDLSLVIYTNMGWVIRQWSVPWDCAVVATHFHLFTRTTLPRWLASNLDCVPGRCTCCIRDLLITSTAEVKRVFCTVKRAFNLGPILSSACKQEAKSFVTFS